MLWPNVGQDVRKQSQEMMALPLWEQNDTRVILMLLGSLERPERSKVNGTSAVPTGIT